MRLICTIVTVLLALACGCHKAVPPGANLNIMERHSTATSLAAGAAAYYTAKKTGEARAASGQPLNFLQRHPVLTGLGAAVATKAVLRHTANRKIAAAQASQALPGASQRGPQVIARKDGGKTMLYHRRDGGVTVVRTDANGRHLGTVRHPGWQ